MPSATPNPRDARLVVRKHWFILFSRGLLCFFLALLPLILFAFLRPFFPPEDARAIALALLFFYLLYLLLVWLYFFVAWTDYYLDIWMLTEEKIVAVELRGLFHRIVSEFALERIQDVTVVTSGIFEAAFGYGTLRIQTAGERQEHLFRGAAHPERAKSIIMSSHEYALRHARSPKEV